MAIPRMEWLADLEGAFRETGALLAYLGLPELPEEDMLAAPPLLVPRAFAAKMRKGDAADPLLRQVLPSPEELKSKTGFGRDPVGDCSASLGEGVIQKYRSRALLVSTTRCAVHCRFCFRRHTLADFSGNPQLRMERIQSVVASRKDIEEIILSGGDPLMESDATLADILFAVEGIEQIQTIRIHTRAPIVLPSRVQEHMVRMLSNCNKTLVLVLHTNHPREIGADNRIALAALRDTGAVLLNQSVLLKGVNDDADILLELSRKLVAEGVIPYYLHQLDPAEGTHHFEVPVETGRAIIETMRQKGAGYLVPRYVQEIPGEYSKSPL